MKKIFIAFAILIAGFVYLITSADNNTDSIPTARISSDDDCGEQCAVPEKQKPNLTEELCEEDKLIQNVPSGGKLRIVMFYSRLCPHCEDAAEFLKALELPPKEGWFYEEVKRYQALADANIKLELKLYEILDNPYNRELFEYYCEAYEIRPKGLPVFFIGSKAVESFPKADGAEIVAKTILYAQNKLDDKDGEVYNIPLIGDVASDSVFLPTFTIFLGFIDGLNPCAMWVLVFLLGILAYSRSKKRMLLVGVTFVAASGIVYFLLMTAWLNLFIVIGFNRIVMIILACIAIVMGLINIKELVFFKEGVSLMIPEAAKPSIYKKTRIIMREKSVILTICLTFVFAFFVNIIELACTAGFPAIFTKILADRNEPVVLKYLYMALYNVFYVQPLLIIVVIFSITLGHFKMQEKHAKMLKLISGGLMLLLGILMLVQPELMIG